MVRHDLSVDTSDKSRCDASEARRGKVVVGGALCCSRVLSVSRPGKGLGAQLGPVGRPAHRHMHEPVARLGPR